MLATAAVLATVASMLTSQPVIVTCGSPPSVMDGWGRALAAADPNPDRPHIYMRPWVCQSALRREPYGLMVFAHEILHVLRPWWPHWRVHRWDDWYGRTVVRRKLIRVEERSTR